jgi:hypothetical protein
MAYLTFISDNCDTGIPLIVAFLHSHRQGFFEAWHVDTPLHNNVVAMRMLNLDNVVEMGYVNLRCNCSPGCRKRDRRRNNAHVTCEVWGDLMGWTSTPVFAAGMQGQGAVRNVRSLKSSELERGADRRMAISSTCCAQFTVSRDRIHERPLEDYVQLRGWLIESIMDDAHSGRVFERLWHIIFGMAATVSLGRGPVRQ